VNGVYGGPLAWC